MRKVDVFSLLLKMTHKNKTDTILGLIPGELIGLIFYTISHIFKNCFKILKFKIGILCLKNHKIS